MIRKIVLLSVIFAALLCSGCSSWHIPFFGSEEAKEEEPLVQDAKNTADEEPQYSGPTQTAAPAPAAAAYGQNPAAGAFQPGQPYNPNANYAAGATPGYGAPAAPAYGAQPYGAPPAPYGAPPAAAPYGAGQPGAPAYGAYPAGQQPGAPGAYGAPQPYGTPPAPPAYGQGIEQSNLGAPQGGAFLGAPADDNLAFGGIKRKVLFIISYPQRGLSTVAYDPFSQKIFAQLAAAPGINLVPREAVEQVSEKYLNQALDAKTRLSRLGKELGAQAIILERVRYVQNFNGGAYGYTPPKQSFQLQLIDTATGYPVKTYTLDPAAPGANQVINSLVGNIRMIDWSARVIKVEKNRVLINAGRLSGLQPGQNLRVYAKGSEIKDPTTKLSLGQAQGALKGTIKVVDFFGIDGAICEPVAAGRFKQGDMVKAVE